MASVSLIPLAIVELGDAALPASECWSVAVRSSRKVLGPSYGGVVEA